MKDPEIEDISQHQLQPPMDVHMHSCVPHICKRVYTHACYRHTHKESGKRNDTARDPGESDMRLKKLKGLVMLKFSIETSCSTQLLQSFI